MQSEQLVLHAWMKKMSLLNTSDRRVIAGDFESNNFPAGSPFRRWSWGSAGLGQREQDEKGYVRDRASIIRSTLQAQ